MKYEWLPCPRHEWLGVSVLLVNDSMPICYREDGTAHLVDPAELERAA